MNSSAEEVWEKLTSHRVQIVQELRVDRAILFDYLRSKSVFDHEDCEIVRAEKTNEQKASKLLDILETKGTEGLEHFLDVLQLLNPSLYEKLTGQTATARENPILSGVGDKSFTDAHPQFDVDILSNHLKRALKDLQEMTLMYHHQLKEKQQLNQNLSKMTNDLELKSKSLQYSEREIIKAEEREREARYNAEIIKETATFQIKECEKAMSECNALSFALLMNLLSSKQQVEEGRKKHEELTCKLRELSKSFDEVRRQSLMLSEKIALQQDRVRTAEDLTKRNRELQFISQKLQIEKDQAISELNELRSWADALKTRYDIMEKNKQQCQETCESVADDCSLIRKKMKELQFQLSISQRREEYLKEQNAELTHFAKKCQEQRDFYGEETRKAMNEREEARKERDQITQRYSDVLKEKDEAVRRFLQESREFQCQHELDTTEMRALRERLIRAEEELKILKMEGELSLGTSERASDDYERTSGNGVQDDDDDDHFSEEEGAIQAPVSRISTDILKSMKNRVYQTVQEFPSVEITDKLNSQIRFAQWLCRLPHHPWTPMACSTPSKSPLDEVPAIGEIIDLNWSSPPFPATYETSDDRQEEDQNGRMRSRETCPQMETTLDSLDESKGKFLGSYAIDDSIIPERRPRAYDLDRTKTPRRLRHP